MPTLGAPLPAWCPSSHDDKVCRPNPHPQHSLSNKKRRFGCPLWAVTSSEQGLDVPGGFPRDRTARLVAHIATRVETGAPPKLRGSECLNLFNLCHRGQDATRCPCRTRAVIAPKQEAMKDPLEHFSRSSEETASVLLALLPTPQLRQCQPSHTTSTPPSFPGDALTMPTSATLAPLTRLLQRLLWFVLTFAVAQKAVSAPKRPDPAESSCGKALARGAPSFERPLLSSHSPWGQGGG